MTEPITLEALAETGNIAETLAREFKAPQSIETPIAEITRVALPPGWKLSEIDDEKHTAAPRRKRAKVRLHDAPSFIDYVRRHGSLADSTVWCEANYAAGKVAFAAILNDHGEEESQAAWRDHTAHYTPVFSQEWSNWVGKNKTAFSQADFAQFIEDNLKDVTSAEGLPTGSQMLEMALSFEANQDMRFKSAIRLQNGGVQMSFVQDDDSQTLAKMQLFDRFAIGIPVFWNGDAYRVDARLRYRVRDGKLTFWFELIRQDKVLEAATTTLIEQIRNVTGCPFFFGEPFVG
jgi:uncharacterized protein YfdQ (DUF2303 family)